MADRSHIEWTDATWSPVTGCTRISEGCRHCYIERTPPFRMAGRKFDGPDIGATTGVQLHPDRLDQPLKWRKPRRIFVCSMADLFHDDVPDEYIARVWAAMAAAPQHSFQVLTKRPARMRSLLTNFDWRRSVFARESVLDLGGPPRDLPTWPLPNVWAGVSAESQQWADIRIPILLDTPAAVRFVSCEPLLGPVTLPFEVQTDRCTCYGGNTVYGHEPRCGREPGPAWGNLHWVITGGESGPGSRPAHPDWFRSLRDQCAAAGVPFLFKQWGEWGPAPWTVDREPGESVEAYKARAGAIGATHAMPVWSHQFNNMITPAGHQPWSVERCPLAAGDPHAGMRRWGKKAAGRMLDARVHDEYPPNAAWKDHNGQ